MIEKIFGSERKGQCQHQRKPKETRPDTIPQSRTGGQEWDSENTLTFLYGYRLTDGRTDRRMVRWTDGWMDGWIDGRTDGRTGVKTKGQIDGWMGG